MKFDELQTEYFEAYGSNEQAAATYRLQSALAHSRAVQGASCPPALLERRTIIDPKQECGEEIDRLRDWALGNGVSTEYRIEQ